jgi:carbamoyl-phosphate synthase large subunit
MLSAAGRRVALMRLFEATLADMGVAGHVIATDIGTTTPAMQAATDRVVVPPYRDPTCLSFLLQLCRERQVRLIVPTIDTELAFYAEHRAAFEAVGCRINIAARETIQIGADKEATHRWLTNHGFPTVRQASLPDLLAGRASIELPVLIKPRYGSSSKGISIARRPEDMQARSGEADLLGQSVATGWEYTIDTFVDSSGRCRCAVPRRRLETRGGEVSKGMTVRLPAVAALARAVVEALPGAYGVMNVQIFHDPATQRLAVIEINPRFGGGYPLSHQAGAPMTRWLLEDVLGVPSTARDDTWEDGLVMLRYDEAVFVPRSRTDVRN